jgi:D-beta-D-heptose 7-phosphate kinase / D-beta-D-heptose 1-phosphate adenosyltransferase
VKERFIKTQPRFEMLLRADSETRTEIKAATEKALLDVLEKAAEGADHIVISDYAKGMLSRNLIESALASARAKGKKVVVDTKGDISAYKGGNVILVPNLHELGAASKKEMKNDDADVRTAALALSKSNGSTVVVKRSGKGASIADASAGAFRTWPSMAKGVVNVSGAGDIFVAIFTLALASGKGMDDAVKLANAGCAKAIAKQHPSITKAELPELG